MSIKISPKNGGDGPEGRKDSEHTSNTTGNPTIDHTAQNPTTNSPHPLSPRKKYYRKVIRITGFQSPNVRFAQEEIAAGMEPSGTMIVPGVLPWDELQRRLETWDEELKCIGIYARFHEGGDEVLYMPEWLSRAEVVADDLITLEKRRKLVRQVESVGVDPGEGKANSVWTAGDRYGVIWQRIKKTKDTNIIPFDTRDIIEETGVTPENVVMDIGGGGIQHADRLRAMGYEIRLVDFGGATSPAPFRPSSGEKRGTKELRQAYKNMRAELYGQVVRRLDPGQNETGFGIPRELVDLHYQLSRIPKLRDGEGKLRLPPKNRTRRGTETSESPGKTELTMEQLIGRSPDEADSFVLMVYGLDHPFETMEIGAAF